MSTDDEREAMEAAALRRAIDQGTGEKDVPGEALEAAALIRFGARGGAIDPAASKRILDELLEARRPARSLGRARAAWWFVPAFGAVAAAAGIVAVVLISRPGTLPRPPVALLRAQAAVAAGGPSSAAAALDVEMRAYRRAVLAEVARR